MESQAEKKENNAAAGRRFNLPLRHTRALSVKSLLQERYNSTSPLHMPLRLIPDCMLGWAIRCPIYVYLALYSLRKIGACISFLLNP